MDSIGQRLQKARQFRHLTLEQAAEATRIRARYLQALEADDYSIMPSAAQGRGFLRMYADFLGLEIDRLLEELRTAQPDDSGLIGPGLPAPAPVAPRPEPPPAPVPEPEPDPEPAAPRDPFWRAWLARLRPAPGSPPFWRRWLARLQPADGSEPFWRRWLPKRTRPAAPAAPATLPPGSAEKIFSAIGDQLRQRRELLGLSLPDVEQSTHVRQHYLLALEEGRLDRLPSPVQTRGMLSNYAAFLDMDVEALLLRFADGLQAERLQRVAVQTGPVRSAARVRGLPPIRTFLIPDLMYGIGIVVALLTFAVWGAIRLTAQTIGEVEPTPPSISDVLLASPEAGPDALTPTNLAVPASAGTAEPFVPNTPLPGSSDAPVQVYLVTTERTWLRVTVDGKVLLEGRVLPGATYPFSGQDRIEVLAGNAAAVRVTFNGRDLGLMGDMGVVSNRVFTPNGIQTPTPTPPPTATATPRISPTPSPTQTPRVTPTIFNP